MSTIKSFATVALAGLLAAPLSAQVIVDGGTVRDRVEQARRRAEDSRTRASIDSGFLRGGSRDSRVSRKIPPGHLPPRGMCRVWIDGVPPGQQPPVESCTQARVRAATTANARVIHGDDQSFPGKGRGKFKNRDSDRVNQTCTVREAVVVGGRVINVCRDGTLDRNRRGRGDDDDRFEDDDDRRVQLSKAERKAQKAARKGNKGNKGHGGHGR